VEERADWQPGTASLVRIALVVFVLMWIFGPDSLRDAVPIWIVFAIALGLELQFLVAALRAEPSKRPDRRPQTVDRDRFGYEQESDDLLLLREGDEEVWLALSEGEEEDEIVGQPLEPRAAPPTTYAEPRPRARPVRRFLVGLGIIGALVLAIWFVESRTGWDSLDRETRIEATDRFADEASLIAGKPVTIYCDESGDFVGAVQHADGVAIVGGDHAYLTPERCHDLYRLAFEDEVTGSQTGRALAVLAHEAWHLRGVSDEGTTECYALQSGVELGRRLGLSEDRARQLMRQQLAENALRAQGAFEYLVPPECRDGGRLDLDPGSSRFP
jgi:hypothetical protein